MPFGVIEQLVEQGRRHHDVQVGTFDQTDASRCLRHAQNMEEIVCGPVAGASRFGDISKTFNKRFRHVYGFNW